MTTTPSADTRARVLAYLVAEADMDGLVTTVGREMADAVGIHRTVASAVVRQLEADGALSILQHGTGRGPYSPGYHPTEIQLAESVLA